MSPLDEAGYQHPAFDRTRRLVEQGLRQAKAKPRLNAAARIAPLAFFAEYAASFLELFDLGLADCLV
ncbi:hypothetical protein JOD31_001717 [Methylopila capsulata]|uniref:Uncharacterized protein n=1 Tax=Methylopila capsulata TaxID=61654 RepID=A0A9W6MR21_9HYPH|nr:hypothetical protein [Methylopila capsulata]MBM7851492.1 hypothetical protein [Methylopila capsulata]GLK54551.1 hypothetical protein GCM10008170_05700 [Methylopila capsulata]